MPRSVLRVRRLMLRPRAPTGLRTLRSRRCTTPGFLLQWHVTERCNLRCAHCYQEGVSHGELDFEGQRDVVEQLRRLLAALRERWERPTLRGQLTITGGEPFVRRDFLRLLEHVARHRRELSFAVLTNGTLVDAPLARRLARLRPRFVQVSLEGRPETHDAIRGRGSYRRAVRGLKHLERQGVRTMISFTASRRNRHEFGHVARLGRRLGVYRVWADRLIPAGRGEGMQPDLLDPEETRTFFASMKAAREEAARERPGWDGIAMHRALQFLVGGGLPYRCTAGDTLLTVLPNGDLLPCRRMPIRVGNVKETPLAELYASSDLLRRLRDPTEGGRGCEACPHAYACRGGLRCLAYAVTGDPLARDPGCWLDLERPG